MNSGGPDIRTSGAPSLLDFSHFLLWEQTSRDSIHVKRVYIDMAGDLAAGVLLSQIVYWHLPNDEGRTRLRVEVDGYLWLVKGYSDWWEECRLTFKQARRAVEILQGKELILTCTRKFDGAPRVHIRINREPFLAALNGFALWGKSTCPVGQMDLPPEANGPAPQGKSYKQRLQTDITAETTASAEGSPRFPKAGRTTKKSADAASLSLGELGELGESGEDAIHSDSANPEDLETAALIAALIAAALNRSDAKRLAVQAPEEAWRQLEYLPFKKGLENPGGYLRSAIESGFPAPKEYKAAKVREAREKAKAVPQSQSVQPSQSATPTLSEPPTPESNAAIPANPLRDVWATALGHLEQIVNTATLNAHLKPMRLVSITEAEAGESGNSIAVLVASSAFAKTWIEGHNKEAVEAALGEALGRPVTVRITTGGK